MTPHDSDLPDVAERNLANLIRQSYRPEDPDPAFVAQLQRRLLASATPPAARIAKTRLRLGWLMAVAAACAAVGLFVYAQRTAPPRRARHNEIVRASAVPADSPGRLVPKARPEQ